MFQNWDTDLFSLSFFVLLERLLGEVVAPGGVSHVVARSIDGASVSHVSVWVCGVCGCAGNSAWRVRFAV